MLLNTSFKCRFFHLTRFALLLGLALSSIAKAQETEAEDTKALITKIYTGIRAAKTVNDYTAGITACEEAQEMEISDSQKQYLGRLSAFALNKRGLLYADDAVAKIQKGDDALAAELDEKALVDFNLSIQRDPSKWRPLHNRGISFAASGQYDKALVDFDRVLKMNRGYANAWFNRGETNYALGQFEKAVADYDRFIQLKGGDAEAHTSRGHALFQLRRFRSALNDYSRAVSLAPRDAEARANRADAYQSLGMWQRAADDYRRAIDLDDKLARAYQSAAWLMATSPSARFRNDSLGLRSARKAIEVLGTENHQYLDTLAAAQANAGQFDEAVATITSAIKIAPEEELERLNYRLGLYEQKKPYRQGMIRSAAR